MRQQEDGVAAAIAPMRDALAALRAWQGESRGRLPEAPTVADLDAALSALSARQAAVALQMPLPAGGVEALNANPAGHAALGAWRARRAALLRLAVWSALNGLRSCNGAMAARGGPLGALGSAMAESDLRVPPGLTPTLQFAGNERMRDFFNRDLRLALEQGARRHQALGALLARLDSAGADVGTVAGAHAWGEAWSHAVAANYLDCLEQTSGGNLDVAMSLLWGKGATQLHLLAGLRLMPAGSDVHADLWTDLMQAQALDHQPSRFERPHGWQLVALDLHKLGASEEGRARRRFDRGLRVHMLHLPPFADRARLALPWLRRHDETVAEPCAANCGAAITAAGGRTYVIELPDLAPGQEANFRLVLRLLDTPRRAMPFDAPLLDDEQRAVYARWCASQAGAPALELKPRELDWRAAPTFSSDLARSAGSEGALGSAALWRALHEAGCDNPQWLDVVVVVRRNGRWKQWPLELDACAVGDELHCHFAIDDATGHEVPPQAEVARVQRALAAQADGADGQRPIGAANATATAAGRQRWVATPAGLGAMVMLGIDLDVPDSHD